MPELIVQQLSTHLHKKGPYIPVYEPISKIHIRNKVLRTLKGKILARCQKRR